MTVARELQNLVADVSAAIATRDCWGRAELEVLRRKLAAAAEDAATVERAGFTGRTALATLCDGIDAQIADLSGLARRARAQGSAVLA